MKLVKSWTRKKILGFLPAHRVLFLARQYIHSKPGNSTTLTLLVMRKNSNAHERKVSTHVKALVSCSRIMQRFYTDISNISTAYGLKC